MRIEESITEVRKVIHRYCDICGVETTEHYRNCICSMCQKDMCAKCVGHIDDSLGDYPDYYCKTCWDKGEKYRTEKAKFDAITDELFEEWQKNCENK